MSQSNASTQTTAPQDLASCDAIVSLPTRRKGEFAKFLVKGRLTDFTVRCQGYEWKVHEIILCLRSEYFEKLCTGHFVEAADKSVNFPAEDPRLIARVLIFLYTDNYPLNSQDFAINGHTVPHFAIFAADDRIASRTLSASMLDVKMYAMGDMFCMESLKREAVRRFAGNFLKSKYFVGTVKAFEAVEIINLTEVIYDTTPENDCGFRDVLLFGLHKLCTERGLLDQPSFSDYLHRRPQAIAVDMLSSFITDDYWVCITCWSRNRVLKRRCACTVWKECNKPTCGRKITCFECGTQGCRPRILAEFSVAG